MLLQQLQDKDAEIVRLRATMEEILSLSVSSVAWIQPGAHMI